MSAGSAGGAGQSKRQRFFLILLALIILSLVASLIIRETVLEQEAEVFSKLAVVGPMSGPDSRIGQSLRQGTEIYIDQINDKGGLDGRRLALDVIDDSGATDAVAQRIRDMAKGDTLGAVGHWRDDRVRALAPTYAESGLPLIVPAALSEQVLPEGPIFGTMFGREQEARFLANYARNVLGHKLMSIIQDVDEYGTSLAEPFEATYRRFGTAIRYNWLFDSSATDPMPQLKRIVEELSERKDAGALFLAVRGEHGAALVRMIRDARLKNVIVAHSALSTQNFMEAVSAGLPSGADKARYTDGIMVSTPLLLDTANEQAQAFATRYRDRYGAPPDWVAAYAYEAAHLLVSGLKSGGEEVASKAVKDLRKTVLSFLEDMKIEGNEVGGIAGSRGFGEDRRSRTPVLIGAYNGLDMVSALTQLQPITSYGRTNYIGELRKGKVLYVNDRFMYRTNVVYTGIDLKDVSEISIEENAAQMEFVIWFRYRGKFEPNDVEFTNAVEPIELKEPIDEQQIGDMTYRAYQVSGKFLLNFTETDRFYGSHVLGVSLSHRKLNRNNLLYVVDVLGMNLQGEDSVLDQITRRQAINPNMGWVSERAWLSQDISRRGTLGDPAYVGYTTNAPEFSRIDLGVLIKRGEVQARDFVPAEYFVYVGVFGLLGSVFAVWMDRKSKRRFWFVQSWFLRLISWPLLLTAAGNLALQNAFHRLDGYYIDIIVMAYDMLWWIVPARIAALALERFIWLPLEEHTGRTIPNVVRVFGSVTLYSLAVFGIIAFVFDQKVTSLLATSGLLAMIVGLAIQANISNIFSGIVLNIERPFAVGDWVQIGEMEEGRIIDITWRTTRVQTRAGYVISVPNGQVSEAGVHNFDSGPVVRLEIEVEVDARYNHDVTDDIMTRTAEKLPYVVKDPQPEVRFTGMKWNLGWVATYEVQIWIEDYGIREEVVEGVHVTVWDELIANGIYPSPDTLEKGFLPKFEDLKPDNRPVEEH
ncbi:ABC transporter substrate-binding protein [Magnetospira sp. QH-2]|uniref:ABC transporter substrate-binding protein n=1 Tax=Magnetospira sp. (strain QH-2) TaxID=1288970 RepID=UPI0003E80B53|nr:ABC transporter substrate-binding protein [Magnetospira sp. QH-2]CCQ73215.1 Conserved protein of unknown function. Containing MscS Mechanosensitive ion channel domain [Magnetospira sp. QH-2]